MHTRQPTKRTILLWVLGVIGLLDACRPASVALRGGSVTPAVAIRSVTLVDVEAGRTIPGQTVLVRGDTIVAVLPDADAGALRLPPATATVDGRGKFLMPGLWDMHVHFMNAGVSALPLLVAHGVTGVREMGGYLDSTRAWQRRMASGELMGPRIVTAGPILESPVYLARVRERDGRLGGRLVPRIIPYRIGVADSVGAERAVDSLVRLGVDFVKIRNTGSPDAYRAILRAARRANLPVAGHLPGGVTVADASAAGQRSIEHLFLPTLAAMAPAAREAVYAQLARNGTWLTPTLAVSRAGMLPDSLVRRVVSDSTGSGERRMRSASRWFRGWWQLQLDERVGTPEPTPQQRTESANAYASGLADVRGAHAAGAGILAGTDAGSLMVFPGSSLHEELALLVEDARLSPRDALWAATVGPARYLGRGADLGRVAPGYRADLVLLDGNPLTDIRNTGRIDAVVVRGRLLRKPDLAALQEEAERLARAPARNSVRR